MSVSIDKIAIVLGMDASTLTTVQIDQWNMLVEDAEMLIEQRRLRLDAGPVDEAKRDYVVRQAVVDHIRRPDNATQITVSVDDASTSRTYQTAAGRVTILSEWWDLLGLQERSGAFAIDTVGMNTRSHADICTLNFGGMYCSCGTILTNLFPLYEIS